MDQCCQLRLWCLQGPQLMHLGLLGLLRRLVLMLGAFLLSWVWGQLRQLRLTEQGGKAFEGFQHLLVRHQLRCGHQGVVHHVATQ